ncbi:MAG: hypothetical protein A2Y33_12440 [Spirochaetes bacterium GWF1_51_8]|nr:MAG: hypothetical protein A2Y33_12440 [Spirochaetes bacterium GWF1_51_8]
MAFENVSQWMLKAYHDLLLARHELERPSDEMVTEGVCFHCQQCAEKALKAFLVSKHSEISRTHDLEFLLMQCIQIDKTFETIDTGKLSDYAVEIRYPDDFYIPEIAEAKEAYSDASIIYEFVSEKLG